MMLTAYLLRIIFDAQLRWVSTPLDLPLIALFFLAVVSSFSSIEQYASLLALIKLANYILVYFIIVNTIRERHQVRRVAYTIMGVGCFLAIFGMIKYLGEVCPPWWDYDVKYKGMVATFGCKNHLAGYMEMAIPISIGLMIAVKKGWAKALCGFALFLLCVALTLSLSRLAEKQKWIEAASVYKQVMPEGVFADRTGYYLRMGRYLLCGGKEKEAETYIKQAIKWEPESAPYHHFYAGLLYKAWRFTEALEKADAAVRTSDYKNPWYLDRKAWILYRMKNYEKSIEAWKLAAQLKPGHKAFRRNIDMAEKTAKEA
jgi:tetratricopeptide (TPR) repeat protein